MHTYIILVRRSKNIRLYIFIFIRFFFHPREWSNKITFILEGCVLRAAWECAYIHNIHARLYICILYIMYSVYIYYILLYYTCIPLRAPAIRYNRELLLWRGIFESNILIFVYNNTYIYILYTHIIYCSVGSLTRAAASNTITMTSMIYLKKYGWFWSLVVVTGVTSVV